MTDLEFWSAALVTLALFGWLALIQTKGYRAWCRRRDVETLWIDCKCLTKSIEDARRMFFASISEDKAWYKDMTTEEMRAFVWSLGRNEE